MMVSPLYRYYVAHQLLQQVNQLIDTKSMSEAILEPITSTAVASLTQELERNQLIGK